MRSPVYKSVAFILFACSALVAQSYRGVYVGLSSGMMPPEFTQVLRGQYTARFPTEVMEATVNGALVTGFKVIPLIPITLAEAVAKFGSAPDVTHMLALLDAEGDAQGLIDPVKRISYMTHELGPNGIVSSIGFYDQNASMVSWTRDAGPDLLQALDAATKKVSLQNLASRPRIAAFDARARFMLQESVKNVQAGEEVLQNALRDYNTSCADQMSADCQAFKQSRLLGLIQATDQVRFSVKQANSIYETNADLFGQAMPPELARANDSARALLSQVPTAPLVPRQQ